MKTLLTSLALFPFLAVALLASRGPTAPAPTSSSAAALQVDGTHSAVNFRIRHLGVANSWGRFDQVQGEVVYDPESPEASTITIEIQADSINTNSDGRDKHLRSPDFFSVKEFPVIRFESKSVEAKGDDLVVTGILELHGEKKEITVDAKVIGSDDTRMGYRAGFDASFTVDLREYGMTFITSNPGALGPEVEVMVSLECVRG